jgi:hypothetical protein
MRKKIGHVLYYLFFCTAFSIILVIPILPSYYVEASGGFRPPPEPRSSSSEVSPFPPCLLCGLVHTQENNVTQINPTFYDNFTVTDTLDVTYTQPANGILTGNSSTLTYIPNPGFTGVDSFILQVQNATDPTMSSVTEMNVIVDPNESQRLVFGFLPSSQFSPYELWLLGLILEGTSITALLLIIGIWVNKASHFAVFSSYQFGFLTIFVIGHILTISFLPHELLGDQFPISTMLYTDSENRTQWVLNIGGPLQGINPQNSLGIQIPIFVIVGGILGAYIRYLYLGVREFKESHKSDVFKLRDREYEARTRQPEKTKPDTQANSELEKSKNKFIFRKTKPDTQANSELEKSKFELRFDVIDDTLTNVGFFFLAPLLAILAWLLLTIGGTDNQAIFAVVSFAIGLTTRTIVDRVTSFVEQTFGTYAASAVRLTVKAKRMDAKELDDSEIRGSWVTLTVDESYKTGLTPFTFEGAPRSNGTKRYLVVTIEKESKDGLEFYKWEDDSTDNPRSLPLNADKTIIAFYRKKGESEIKTALDRSAVG